jgi:hypothetical protein
MGDNSMEGLIRAADSVDGDSSVMNGLAFIKYYISNRGIKLFLYDVTSLVLLFVGQKMDRSNCAALRL